MIKLVASQVTLGTSAAHDIITVPSRQLTKAIRLFMDIFIQSMISLQRYNFLLIFLLFPTFYFGSYILFQNYPMSVRNAWRP